MADDNKIVDRRKFIGTAAAGAGLLAAGGLIGWLTNRSKATAFTGKQSRAPLDQRFSYDVAEFLKIDPKLIQYAETQKITTEMQAPKCIAIDVNDRLYIGGDQMVKVFDRNSVPQTVLKLPGQPHAVTMGADGQIYVALKNQFLAFDAAGKETGKSEPLGEKSVLTAIAQRGDWVYLADAGSREVLICDKAGAIQKRIGRMDTAAKGQGFQVPSPYFDLLVDDAHLYVVNPGRNLVQIYTHDGNFEQAWGGTGLSVERFSPCCNPSHIARLADGRFVTSEKGINRIKVYSAKGEFQCVVAGPEELGRSAEQAQKAIDDATAGIVFDIACDSAGKVYALDPARKLVRVFASKVAA
jgi:DNA-binding beta-propeller fold protein YncE